MITMESIKEKLGFDPIEYFKNPPAWKRPEDCSEDDSKPRVWDVLSLDEMKWLRLRLEEAGFLGGKRES